MLVVLILSTLYAAPNFFGEAPAVQVTGKRATAKIDSQLQSTIEAALSKEKISFEGISRDDTNIKVRFADTNTQLKARDVLNQALNPVTDSPE
jgi:preprotein translocase subunit SecD